MGKNISILKFGLNSVNMRDLGRKAFMFKSGFNNIIGIVQIMKKFSLIDY